MDREIINLILPFFGTHLVDRTFTRADQQTAKSLQ